MLGAVNAWTAMSVAIKVIYKTSSITAFEVLYYRNLFPIPPTLVWAHYAHVNVLMLPTKQLTNMLLRVICCACGFVCVFLSLQLMSYSKYVSISYIFPVLTQLFAAWILNERLTVHDGVNGILSFLGVLIITTESSGSLESSGIQHQWALVVPVFAAVFIALGDVYQRKIKHDIHFLISPMYQYIGCCLLSAGLALATLSHRSQLTQYGPQEWLLLGCIAACGTLGTTLYALAYGYEKAGRLAALNYLGVVNAFLVDYLLFNEAINKYDVIGALLILTGNVAITLLRGFGIIP